MEENDLKGKSVEQMKKRRELMEDGRRYIIYYTFERDEGSNIQSEVTSEGETDNV